MIPVATSNDNNGCVPTSSNCIIWQGPDIPCINICHGDNVSEVVYKLATELCDVLGKTNLQTLDLSCLQLAPDDTPTNLSEFNQMIVDQLCSLGGRCDALEGGSGGGGTTEDTIIQFASCFSPATEGTVEEYAALIGTKVCDLVSEILTINSTLVQHNTRITALENADNSFTLPQVTPTCVLTPTPQDMNVVLEALEEEFCELKEATGTASQLIAATGDQCPNLSAADRLSGSGTMASIPGWNTQVVNLSHSISNLWLVICDMRTALENVMDCCAADCTDIILVMSSSLNPDGTTLTIDFTGSVIPSDFISCNPLGSLITVTDSSGNTYTERAVISNLVDFNTALTVNLSTTSLTPGSNLTIALDHCVGNGQITCEKRITDTVINGTSCPSLENTIGITNIDYAFLHTQGSGVSYIIDLLDMNDNVIATKTHNNQPNGTLSGSFTSLTSATNYKIRASVVVSGQANTVCPATQVTTLSDGNGDSCALPTDVTVTIDPGT